MKNCSKCKTYLSNDKFNKDKRNLDGLRSSCKKCQAITQKQYRIKNKEKISEYNKIYNNSLNDDCKNLVKEWKKHNKDRVNKNRREYYKKKIKDPNFKLAKLLRDRLKSAIKRKTKIGSAVKDLGCSVEELKLFLKQQFQEGMTWDNHGIKWQIDHIKPLASFDLTDRKQFLSAFHYTNLQPLWVSEHKEKTKKDIKNLSVLGP